MDDVIRMRGLRGTFGEARAIDGLDLSVAQGVALAASLAGVDRRVGVGHKS